MSETTETTPAPERKKQRFVVKPHFDPSSGVHRQDLFIDDKLFPYEIDQASLMRAKEMGPSYFAIIQKEIMTHFVDSLSNFMGRKVSMEEVVKATKEGWI